LPEVIDPAVLKFAALRIPESLGFGKIHTPLSICELPVIQY
jgi:hypothetical protein